MWMVWTVWSGCTDVTTSPTDQGATADTPGTDSSPSLTDDVTTDTATPGKPCGPDALVGVDEGFCAPDFTLPDRTGTDITLYDSRGKVLLVDLVALWCHSCFELAPSLELLHETYASEGFEIFTIVAQDVAGDTATIEHAGQWVDTLKVSHPVVADVTGKAQWEWTRNPTQVVIPMTYIIDQQGVVTWFGSGDHHAPRMEEVVTELLGVTNQEVVDAAD